MSVGSIAKSKNLSSFFTTVEYSSRQQGAPHLGAGHSAKHMHTPQPIIMRGVASKNGRYYIEVKKDDQQRQAFAWMMLDMRHVLLAEISAVSS